ncbi:hypothetical protein ACFLTE_04165 [Bacteroidota bacterium]
MRKNSKYYKQIKPRQNYRVIIVYILIILDICLIPAFAQQENTISLKDLNESFGNYYRLDQNLINGIQFYNLHPNAPGHAYFNDNEYTIGNIMINNKIYHNVNLKYDLCKQRVLLEYDLLNGGTNQIILHNNDVDEFILNGKLFRKLNFPETGSQFFQIVSDENNIVCLYHWNKQIVANTGSLDSYYQYTDQKKKTYLLIDNNLYEYNRNLSFVRLFPENQQPKIKRFIRTNKIKLKEISEETTQQLIRYCVDLAKNPNIN